MTSRLEIESAIKQLPESEARNLAKWLEEYLNERKETIITGFGSVITMNMRVF